MASDFLPTHRGIGFEVYKRPNGAWRWIVFAPSDSSELLRIGESNSKEEAIEACKAAIDAMLDRSKAQDDLDR